MLAGRYRSWRKENELLSKEHCLQVHQQPIPSSPPAHWLGQAGARAVRGTAAAAAGGIIRPAWGKTGEGATSGLHGARQVRGQHQAWVGQDR